MIFNKIYTTEKSNITSNIIKKKKSVLPYDLKIIYTKSKYRVALAKIIRKRLCFRNTKEEYYIIDIIDQLKLHINLGKLLGTGDWGNVYTGCLEKDKEQKRKFAVKISRITEENLKDPYTNTSSSWYEIWILNNICQLIIETNICPNLPLVIDTFLCKQYNFKFRKGNQDKPAVITLMELAHGDLKDYFNFCNPTDDELYSCLFQIMAGLHCIQMTGQILNNDIKARNILFYNVNPGGYWHYRLKSYDFYVPNYGKIFILNDFGVSTLYNPAFQLFPNKERPVFNIGSRYAINMDGKFSPINSKVNYDRNGIPKKIVNINWVNKNKQVVDKSSGVTFKLHREKSYVLHSHTRLTEDQKKFLFRNGITTNSKNQSFFHNSLLIPPFEFYNDVQDSLRTFVGGKRATQKGSHPGYNNISKKFKDSIEVYMGLEENSYSNIFLDESYQVLAGEFILKFFTTTCNYQNKPKNKILGYYNMNKCLKFKKS